MKILKVKEIKKLIELLPDETPVKVSVDQEYMQPFAAGINNDEETGKTILEILI